MRSLQLLRSLTASSLQEARATRLPYLQGTRRVSTRVQAAAPESNRESGDRSTTQADKVFPARLYVYSICPYCCKVRAFMDYHRLPYSMTEVNPLTKRELRFSADYKKVPIAVLNSGEQVNDSDRIMDRLRQLLVQGGRAGLSPEPTAHELHWRTWANDNVAKLLPPNIYRTLSESLEAFEYISASPHFSALERQLLRWSGAVMMRALQPKMRRKYGLEAGQEREALMQRLEAFMHGAMPGAAAVGGARDRQQQTGLRPFSGGDKPDMADLTLYGMLRAVQGMRTSRDVMSAMPTVAEWYQRVQEAVREQQR
ncbi:hypothetical protein CDCA_CDCA20G4777 [Cyanidium caldarium]|uniref:GST C-terminal domain-containing protein n=1 Tax=Cyanidium caldarium TaxID=2771 RepID=A0AAV9J2E7_CYACA|nr:hypothetical protein CDCA_CDCA20G4777 [Cyanidium caldarium]